MSSPIEFTEGQPYLLNISAAGNPADLEYFWLNGAGEPVTGGSGISIQGGVMSVLRATRKLAGTYTVFANNSEGAATSKFQIDILYAPRYVRACRPTWVNPVCNVCLECTMLLYTQYYLCTQCRQSGPNLHAGKFYKIIFRLEDEFYSIEPILRYCMCMLGLWRGRNNIEYSI